jgi:oxygen-independent coproporphyrinogen-3 oxidase
VKLYFRGHNNKYAAEQMLLTLYPGERPEYPDGPPEGDRAEISFSRGRVYATVVCRLCLGGEIHTGRAAVRAEELSDPVLLDRYTQRMIKAAFYRAAIRAGHEKPVWGSLTGVRPGKLMSELLRSGVPAADAARVFSETYDVSPERAELCLDASEASMNAEEDLLPGDVCLYVGIPFCPTRCAYCSFVSQSVEKSMKLIPPYLDALELEIAAAAAAVKAAGGRPVSVYMGGGTPTTLSAPQLDRLCAKLAEHFDLSAVREYTVEAGRPDTITEEKLRVLRSRGVTRVSVNPQTMSDSVLEAIGRRHTAADVLDALDKVRGAGSFELNMDLIAGLTSDTVSGFRQTAETVLSLKPENITVHTLTLKKGSRITLEGAALPTPGEVGAMLDFACSALRGAGYEPYYLYRQKFMSGGFENVGWTLPGHSNLYNICIMEELCPIIAMGAGGSTKLTAPGDGKNIRLMAPKYPAEYISHIEKTCDDKKHIKEFYNGLSAF